MRRSLPAIFVSKTARTVPTMIRAPSTTAAETPTKMFFVVDDLQYQSRDLYASN
jgi:hypothetical protein